jgi:hypothetical protein
MPWTPHALAATCCVAAAALTGCGGGSSSPPSTQATIAAASTPRATVKAPPPPKPLAVALEKVKRTVTTKHVTVRGSLSANATHVTVDGHRARVHGRHFAGRASLHLGRNRVEVVITKDGYRTARKRLLIVRRNPPPPPPPPPPPAAPVTPACPPGEQLLRQMDTFYCGRPGPARPQDCPPNQVPVGVTGACAPVAWTRRSSPPARRTT